MTLSCARCHDHKFDPFSQQDYYGVAGVFNNTEEFGRSLSEVITTQDTWETMTTYSQKRQKIYIRRERYRSGFCCVILKMLSIR